MEIGANSNPNAIKALIQSRYECDGHSRGWSYIYGPLATRIRPEIVTIGLNPGGGREDDIYCHLDSDLSQDASPDVENSYVHQRWGTAGTYTPLQKQIQLLKSHFPLIDWPKVLSFQFVPFRSPSWNEMSPGSYNDAIELGSQLLDWTLGAIDRPRLVVGFGLSAVSHRLIEWFEGNHVESVPTGWGKVKAHIYHTPKAGRLVFLPHLSRYRILGRPEFFQEKYVLDCED